MKKVNNKGRLLKPPYVLLSNFEIETIQSTPKKSGGKRLLIAYIVICLILALGAIVAVIWFYKYYLEGILSSSGI